MFSGSFRDLDSLVCRTSTRCCHFHSFWKKTWAQIPELWSQGTLSEQTAAQPSNWWARMRVIAQGLSPGPALLESFRVGNWAQGEHQTWLCFQGNKNSIHRRGRWRLVWAQEGYTRSGGRTGDPLKHLDRKHAKILSAFSTGTAIGWRTGIYRSLL